MKAGFYRGTALIMISILLLTAVYFDIHAESYYERGFIPIFYSDKNADIFNSIRQELPEGTPFEIVIGDSKVPFNYRLWFDKKIIIYGDFAMCNSLEKDFIPETKDPSGIGYYVKDGVRGEYRYHGFDASTNPCSNAMFTEEEIISSINDIEWIYRPWDPDTYGLVDISSHNLAAENNRNIIDMKTRAWINRPIEIDEEILTFENAGNVSERNASSYIHVMSAPTILYPGEGIGWYMHNDKLYYRTFTLNKLDHVNKLLPEMIATAEIVTPSEGLKVVDYGDFNSVDYLNGEIKVDIKVEGLLLDEDFCDDEVKKSIYYTRYDIDSWDISLSDKNASGLVSIDYNKCEAVFTLVFKRAEIIENDEIQLACKTRVKFLNGEEYEKTGYTNLVFDVEHRSMPFLKTEEDPLVIIIDEDKDLPQLLIPVLEIPSIAFDTECFIPVDKTFMGPVISRKVYIDGILVNNDDFFSGSYLFGSGNTGLKRVDVIYEGANGDSAFITEWVYVYSTKPVSRFILEGNFKQNRKITLKQACEAVNADAVLDKYPIVSYEWSFESFEESGDEPCMRDISDDYKEIMYKEPGKYRIGLIVENCEGIRSEPVYLDFIITRDIEPAIEMNIFNGVLSRKEELNIHHNVSSVDGDHIAAKELKIYYDSDNDGEYDKLVKNFEGGVFDGFTPERLGKYKLTGWAKEGFGGETLEEYINDEDFKVKTIDSLFLVDNLAPVTSIYIDAPVNIPTVDLFIMIDKNLNITRTNQLKAERMEIANKIRGLNIDAKVDIWDTKTYTYDEYVECSVACGSEYPPANLNYSSGNYFGMLELYNVSNNGYYDDKGAFDDMDESRTFYREHENIVLDIYENYKLISSEESSPASVSYSIDEDGFKGDIPRVGTRVNWQDVVKTYTVNIFRTSFSALYSGILTKDSRVWVPDPVWVNEYTGYYRGSIYNSVSQPYKDPFRFTSDKYIMYFSDNGINYPEVYKNIIAYSDAKIILVGDETIRNQADYDLFISKDLEMVDIFDIVTEFIGKDAPDMEKYYVLAGMDEFEMKTVDFDSEQDRIINEEFKYIHDPLYFDNPIKTETFANLSSDPLLGWIDHKADTFFNTGEFKVLRRIKDKPSEDEAFKEYSYYSGIDGLKIYSHRKPVAVLDYSTCYDPDSKIFEIDWICSSFDPDHEHSDPDKGIRARKMIYYHNGRIYYKMPDKLPAGVYGIEYHVRDPEGVWSEPFKMNIVLDETDINRRVDAKIRPVKENFDLSSIPASESIEVYDIVTDTSAEKITVQLMNGGEKAGSDVVISFDPKKDIMDGSNIKWRDLTYLIPKSSPDGQYSVKIAASDISGNGISKEIGFTVNTPIGLKAVFPEKIFPGIPFNIGAETTEYVDMVQVQIFNEISKDLMIENSGTVKEWVQILSVPSTIPTDEYTACFTAVLPSGKQEQVIIPFSVCEVVDAKINIEGYWNHWRGQIDAFGRKMNTAAHRFLGLEKVLVSINLKGSVDKVEIRFSPELESMVYTDKAGNVYDYMNDFGLDYVEFPIEFNLDPEVTEHNIKWEYILPLADSTLGWDDKRLKPAYVMEVSIISGENKTVHIIDDIDITGNTTELTFIQ